MGDGDPLDTTREIGLPICLVARHRLDSGTLICSEITIPAEPLEYRHGELRIAVLNLGID